MMLQSTYTPTLVMIFSMLMSGFKENILITACLACFYFMGATDTCFDHKLSDLQFEPVYDQLYMKVGVNCNNHCLAHSTSGCWAKMAKLKHASLA